MGPTTNRLMFQALFFHIYLQTQLFIFIFEICEKIKKIIETIFAKNFARNYGKKMILGTSDAWSTSHLSQQTSKPEYYILDCRIFQSP